MQFADPELKAMLITGAKEPLRDQERIDRLALARMHHTKSQGEFEWLAEIFRILKDYQDSRQKLEECQATYDKASALLLNCRNIQEVYEAQRLFRSLPKWNNVETNLIMCNRIMEELQHKEQIQQQVYEQYIWAITWKKIKL